MPTMLPPDLEQFLRAEVASGKYSSPDGRWLLACDYCTTASVSGKSSGGNSISGWSPWNEAML